MRHSRYLISFWVTAALSWMGLIFLVSKLNPYSSTGMALALFFLSLFFALTATLTIIGFYLRVWLNRNEIFYNHINISLRQGILLAIVASICLSFLLLSVLTWWTGLLLVAAATLVEFYFTASS